MDINGTPIVDTDTSNQKTVNIVEFPVAGISTTFIGDVLTNQTTFINDQEFVTKKYVDDSIVASADSKVMVSANDTTAGYLEDKVNSSTADGVGLLRTIQNEGANELIQFRLGDHYLGMNSTSLFTGAILSAGATTGTFDLSSGEGFHIDSNTNFTDTKNNVQGVTISSRTNEPITNIASQPVTYILVDENDVILQLGTFPTPTQRRDNIFIGVVVHSDRTNVNAVNNLQVTGNDITAQLCDVMEGLGFFNLSGNVITANGANLSLDKSAGTAFKRGGNYINNKKDPHTITLDVLSALTFRYRNQDSSEGSDITLIDPTTYDNGGVTTTIPQANDATIQRVYIFPSNIIRIMRGQEVFSSLANAIEAIGKESHVDEPNIAENGLLLASIALRKDTLLLNDEASARIFIASRFGELGSVGSSGVTSLQDSYLNSIAPQIVTADSGGSVQFKRGTTGGDSDSVFQILNNAGLVIYDFTADDIIRLGSNTGLTNIGTNAIMIGASAGKDDMGSNTVAIGLQSAYNGLGTGGVAIGNAVGGGILGRTIPANAIAIGAGAYDGAAEQAGPVDGPGTIRTTPGFFIGPASIRANDNTTRLNYDTVSGEITTALPDSLQTAYDNSTINPEILTNPTNGPVSIRNGGVDNSAIIFECQDISAVNKFQVSGNDTLINHTATVDDDHSLEIDHNANGFSDSKAVDIVYTTGAQPAQTEEDAILVVFDKSSAVGGEDIGLAVLATEGNASCIGVEVGAGCEVLKQLQGSFLDPSNLQIDYNGTLYSVTDLAGRNFFVNDNDYIIVGDLNTFEEIEFLLSVIASQNVIPTFEYSTGTGPLAWTSFVPVDGTNGMRNTGVIAWLASDTPGWIQDSGLYKIKITRTRNGLSTKPQAQNNGIKVAQISEYGWDENADITVNTVNNINITSIGTDSITLMPDGTTQTGQGIEAIGMGVSAGTTNQSDYTVAIGTLSGNDTQGNSSVAIGRKSGQIDQGTGCVSVGYSSGNSNQGNNSVSIGRLAGDKYQGENAVSLGYLSGQGNVTDTAGLPDNSISLGYDSFTYATEKSGLVDGAETTRTTAGTWIGTACVRADAVVTGNTSLLYNTTTGEVTYGNLPQALGDWETPTLFTNIEARTGTRVVRYRLIGDDVQIQGGCKYKTGFNLANGNSITLFTLAVGYRPDEEYASPVVFYIESTRASYSGSVLVVNTTGVCTLYNNSGVTMTENDTIALNMRFSLT
jgi:hypothetical protein